MKKTSTLNKVIKRIGRYRYLLLISVTLAAASVILTLYLPILIGNAIDCIIAPGNVDLSEIGKISIKAAVIIGITSLLTWIMNTVNNSLTFNVVRDVRNDAFTHLQSLPLSYLDSKAYGETVNRIISDVDQFADGLLMGFTQLFSGILTILGTLVFMLRIRVSIALVVVVLTPISLFVASFIAKHTHSMFKKQSETRGEQTAFVEEMITHQKIVTAFNHSDEAGEKFDEINNRLEKCSLTATFFSSLPNPSTRFVNSLVYAAVALTGAFAAISGNITVGSLSCFLSYANQYTKPFNEISGVVTELQNALTCASRIFDLIDRPPEVPEADNAQVLENITGKVDIENISFSYTQEKKLIEDFSLTVKPGQKIAIVGPTGCGKTTLINLLMRFYDVKNGAIKVENNDIRETTRKSLRQSFGMVLQDTWLKSGTIKENLILGKPDATDEEIVAAAKAAHAHSFIVKLKDGYDTVIGEDGGSLSQGQKQLLCIARIMLCMPPMLILDEATSSIDTRTEERIQRAFNKLMKGRTSFIVAHRLSTIIEADVILVMNNGNIVEKGTHKQLLEKKGFYYTLYNSQFAQV